MVSDRIAGTADAHRSGPVPDPVGLLTAAATTAAHQPEWSSPWLAGQVREDLSRLPGLVSAEDVAALRARLALVASGGALVVQAGDCAEDPDRCEPVHVRAKVALLDALAEVVTARSGLPVVRVGRLAGQFAKPRSRPTERVAGVELPVYRGAMVNDPRPDPAARVPDPLRMLDCHELSTSVVEALAAERRDPGAEVWTSHEALVLDYEVPLLRPTDGGLLLASAHLPWIGERTRQVDGAHVRLLASVVNPVACKVGPTTTADELRRLCAVLDPHREPGRLTLIARMGADRVRDVLPGLVRAVREAGHPVVWLCDPMHGNTVTGPDGLKVRVVTTLVRELEGFQDAVRAQGGVDGGVHLEATPEEVAECAWTADERPTGPRTTLCDPRLSRRQAVAVLSAWRA
ncbi:3-deoxy-7-phosphoheptulonate synthase [Saccharothrix syringae]|uniref:Phospho-2-dehydro-3-deoxyheptonate aldolase n=1 Tax=Saccharothrix syringae TaxID=103733 RepID=A0A5Q0H095_SACSY|nr:3-deoxy-7-phosphoheptulonate synthase [Saccharothrix syringae]QFZ19618.1 phospho-2-dehydro-3-deoxyheptonate aldolase [Saccharothrix syringae]